MCSLTTYLQYDRNAPTENDFNSLRAAGFGCVDILPTCSATTLALNMKKPFFSSARLQ